MNLIGKFVIIKMLGEMLMLYRGRKMTKVRLGVMNNMENEIVSNNVPGLSAHIMYDEKADEQAPSVTVPMHYHEEIELHFVIKGKKRIVVDGTSYDAGEGDVIFINSGVPHTVYTLEAPLSTLLVQFKEKSFIEPDDKQIISYTSKLKSISEVAISIIRDKELFDTAFAVLNEMREKDVAYNVFIRSEIYKMLGHLYKGRYLVAPDSVKASREVERLLPVLTFINKRYNEDVTLEEVSAISDLDPSYFCRIFKRATGASFTEYLNFVRIANAEKLLADSHKSILEISELVGFSSVSYFNRIFKKYKNCSPRYYRAAKHGENM